MKFENIDLIESMRQIMDIHTEHYKEDFELDARLMRELAVTPSSEDKHILWMSRPNGTHILREREVYVENSPENKTWEFYHDQTNDPILAFAIMITGVEDGVVKGNLIELDYAAHVERMKQLTVTVEKLTVTFPDDSVHFVPFKSSRRDISALKDKFGEPMSVTYLPENEGELAMILRRERFKTDYHAQPGNFDTYIHDLAAQHDKLPVYDRETEILYDVLSRLKMDDIELNFDADGLVATDGDSTWHGAELYHFLIDEAFVFTDPNTVLGLDAELTADFKELAEHNGVPFKDNRRDTLSALPATDYEAYLAIKAEHPDALVCFAQNGYFELYGDDAVKAAPLLGAKLLQKSVDGHETIPVTGFREAAWVAGSVKLWKTGADVFLSKDGETFKELKGADYIPVGATLDVGATKCRIDAVDFAADKVTLTNLEVKDHPVRYTESIAYVRSFVEDAGIAVYDTIPKQKDEKPKERSSIREKMKAAKQEQPKKTPTPKKQKGKDGMEL